MDYLLEMCKDFKKNPTVLKKFIVRNTDIEGARLKALVKLGNEIEKSIDHSIKYPHPKYVRLSQIWTNKIVYVGDVVYEGGWVWKHIPNCYWFDVKGKSFEIKENGKLGSVVR